MNGWIVRAKWVRRWAEGDRARAWGSRVVVGEVPGGRVHVTTKVTGPSGDLGADQPDQVPNIAYSVSPRACVMSETSRGLARTWARTAKLPVSWMAES